MRITVINGHPDPAPERLCHALASAYAAGAKEAGHEVRMLAIGEMEFAPIRTMREWKEGDLPASLKTAQDDVKWAEHLVIIYPLWLGDLPAYLKAFLEQIARPGFAADPKERSMAPKPLKGRSAHVIVTMGMPALVYRFFFFQHSLTSLKRNILEFVGVKPVRETLIGPAEHIDHKKWIEKVRAMGKDAR